MVRPSKVVAALAALGLTAGLTGLAAPTPASADPPQVWDAGDDFQLSPALSNPSGVWAYLGGTEHAPLTQSVLDTPLTGFCGSAEVWSRSGSLPVVGYNPGPETPCGTATFPTTTMIVHPSPTESAIVHWTSPVAGNVAVSGSVADADPNGGDGISWSVDHRVLSTDTTSTVAYGTYANGGSQAFDAGTGGAGLASIAVEVGDNLVLAVAPNGDDLYDNTAVELTITEGAAPVSPTIDVGDASIYEGDSGKPRTLRLPITLSQPAGSPTTVRYTYAGGTATPGVDFKAQVAPKTVTIPAGKVIAYAAIPVTPDVAVDGADETVEVTLDLPGAGYTIGDATGLGTIVDDEASGLRFAIGTASVWEGDYGKRAVTIPVTLSSPALEEVRVSYTITSGDASCAKRFAPGIDCNNVGAITRTLIFKPGAILKLVTVNVFTDDDAESTEHANVDLSNARPTNVSSPLPLLIQASHGAVFIYDDDGGIIVL
jgi:hypothetical protein